MSRKKSISAVCECGQLSVVIHSAPVLQLVCHCADCRSVVGRPSTNIAFFPPKACDVHGSSRSRTMKGGSGKGKTYSCCEVCGTCLYATVGLLDGAIGVVADRLSSFGFKPLLHVWTSEKAAEAIIPGAALRFRRAPPQFRRTALLWSWKYLPARR